MEMMKKVLLFIAPSAILVGGFIALARWGPEGWAIGYVFLMVPTGLIVALVVYNGFRLPSEYLARWQKSHGLEITEQNRSVVRRYLLRGRRIRTLGGLVGFASFNVWQALDAPRNGGGLVRVLACTFAGYLVAAAVAEIWAFRPEPGRVRSASLAPRRITDYVPTPAVVILRALPIAMIALVAAWPAIPKRHPFGEPIPGDLPVPPTPTLWPTLAWVGGAIVLWIFVEITARRIVRRPQPMTGPDLLAADDAIRSTSVHGLVGAGLAIMLGIFSANLGRWGGSVEPSRIYSLFAVLSVFAALAAPFAWLRLGVDQPWVVRRSQPQDEVAA
jgi:hypothetical protein